MQSPPGTLRSIPLARRRGDLLLPLAVCSIPHALPALQSRLSPAPSIHRQGSSPRTPSGGGHRARLTSQPAGLEPSHLLIRAVELRLHGAPDPQSRHGRPDAPLAAADPVLERLLGRRLQQPDKVPDGHLGHERHARSGDALVHQEAADAGGEKLEGVQLAEAVADLEAHHADQEGGHRGGFVAGLDERGAVHVALEKRDQVGAGLADDEVVYVKELGYAQEGSLAV